MAYIRQSVHIRQSTWHVQDSREQGKTWMSAAKSEREDASQMNRTLGALSARVSSMLLSDCEKGATSIYLKPFVWRVEGGGWRVEGEG